MTHTVLFAIDPSWLNFLSRAMEVLDLFFNFRFNTRLEQFVYEFKKTQQQANRSGESSG